MSKIKLLLDMADDMHRLADSIKGVADAISGNMDTPTQTESPKPQKPDKPAISIEQVRAVLADKSGEGKTQEVKQLLYKYDAGKLSGVKPEDYAALMEEAMML